MAKELEIHNVAIKPLVLGRDLIELGNHRILCGDSFNKDNLEYEAEYL